ncbi:hypothetical protein [Ramlibacter sp. PS4R-6]|uniref:hypothetical protein n=1 Tax=Ramlibacter sp. PS4R-6 TaxID=3133438 RepID=UPI0030A613A4
MDTHRTDNDRLKASARRRAQLLRRETLDAAWAAALRWLARLWSRRGGARPVAHAEVARQFR